MRHTLLAICTASIVLCLFVTTGADAGVPRDVDDLVGDRASRGEDALEDRGYRFHKDLKTSNSVIEYWWNSGRQSCIAVTVSDGRYKSILEQPEAVCGAENYSHRSDNRDYGSSTAEIRTVDNGNISVDMGGCNVLFDRNGRVINEGQSCSDSDVRDAKDAYAGHMREQDASAYDEAPPGGFSGSAGSNGRITCESAHGGYQYCRISVGSNGRVYLTRRISDASCREGDSWGYDSDGVWVDKGCRAEFEVR